MKKLVFMVLLTVSVVASAQITTYATGNVNIKRSTEFTMNNLSVGPHTHPSWFSNFQNGVHSYLTNASSVYNVALYGETSADSNVGSGRSIGVLGVGEASTSGYNYGVFGRLGGTQNGAGVFGTVNNNVGINTYGRYAGYFDGPTYVSGTLTATNVVNLSDIRLKENIIPIAESDKGQTLGKVLDMNVIEYNYKTREIPAEERDTAQSVGSSEVLRKDKHYGLVAQELQAIYPDLVKEGEDGYLGVNYVELVPILIRSIQELNEKIETMESEKRYKTTLGITDESASGKAVLYQNSPNPFSSQTVIRFSLPEKVTDASIYIFDMQGTLKRQLAVNSSQTQVTVNAYDLTPGIYLYSLVVGGQEISTKRMILSN